CQGSSVGGFALVSILAGARMNARPLPPKKRLFTRICMTAPRLVGLLSVSALLALGSLGSAQAPLEKATTAWTLKWDADWVTAVSFVGPRRLAAGNTLGDILVWELPEKAGGAAPPPVRRLAGHSNTINRLLATPDLRWLLSASNDRTVGCWDLQ